MAQQVARERGVALALSGGGYRAVLFHCGMLIRLNQLGVLSQLQAVSSVSGGSIVAGVLASRWNELGQPDASGVFPNLREKVIDVLRELTSETLDVGVILGGGLNPFRTAGEQLVRCYRKAPLGFGVPLSALPDNPVFTFLATNYASGVNFRFSKERCADYRVGSFDPATFDLATAVACSSAFPPVLAPIAIDVNPATVTRMPGADLFAQDDYKRRLNLADGGIYDNIGLEPVWDRYETVLVSDAGKPFESFSEGRSDTSTQLGRVRDIALNQALAVRKRWLLNSFRSQQVSGAFWGIGTPIEKYNLLDALPVSAGKTHELSEMRTRLNRFNEQEQAELINWGYAIADAAIRKYVPDLVNQAAPGPQFPFPAYPMNRTRVSDDGTNMSDPVLP